MSSESIEDFKAAFVCVTSNPNGYFKSSQDLTRALQGCGKNPNAKKIDSIWRDYEKIDMDTFCDLAREENSITERELFEAFRYIDINKNGYISTKDFITLFTTNGDSITESEARHLVEEADLNKDGKINYKEFSKFIIDTIAKAKRVARKKMNNLITLKMQREQFERDNFSDDQRSSSQISYKKDDSDTRSLKKSRGYSNQMNDLDRERDLKRPSSSNLKSLLKNELELNRQNSNDSFRSMSKLKHRNEFENEYDKHRLSSEREREPRHERLIDHERDSERHHDRERERDLERHHDRDRDRERERDRDKLNRNYHEDEYINKRDSKNYDEVFDRRRHRSQDRHLNEDIPHRSRSRDEYSARDERRDDRGNKNKEFDFDKEKSNERDSFRKKSSRSSKQNLFETKHKPIDRVIEAAQEPKNLRKWTTKTTKGAFYFNETINGIISNSFALDIPVETSVFFTIETFQTQLHTNENLLNMDVSILIVKDNKKLTLKGFTENKIKNKWSTRLDLSAGRYFLFPFTSGCHLTKREFDFSTKPLKFFEKDINNKRTLSRKFKEALSVIFDMCDLDSNGRLSQEELNLYTFLTANENLSNEEWAFVGETVGFEKNELTKEGFIKLSKIEAQREDTDLDDIAARVANLGFNKSLTIDQSCPFILNVSCEVDQFDLLISEIYKLKAAEQFLSQIIEAKGVPKPVKGVEGLTAFEYHNNYLSFIEFQNESPNDVRLELDCTQSENCLSNCNGLTNNLKIKSMKNKLAMCLTAKNNSKEWLINSYVNINDEQITPRKNNF